MNHGTSSELLLIADSGATKCSWALLGKACGGNAAQGASDADCEILRFETAGLNAAVATGKAVADFAEAAAVQLSLAAGPVASFPEESVTFADDSADGVHVPLQDAVAEIWIYAAGAVSGDMGGDIVRAFTAFFRNARVNVCSDMLGAARAVCGNEPGIVGIIGTGSNSCLYDGERIAVLGLGGGYVLGDEGSGAWVGRRLLSDFIRGLLPPEMEGALKREYSLDYPKVVENVYRSGTPGRYLASFFPFVLGSSKEKSAGADVAGEASRAYAQSLLREGFGAFLDRCILNRYDCMAYPLNLCGSVAWLCRDIIADCARERGIRMGNVLKSPIDGLIEYHRRILLLEKSGTRAGFSK